MSTSPMLLLLGLVSGLVAVGSGFLFCVDVWAALIDSTADVTAERVLLGQVVQEGLLLVVSLWACTWAWTRSRADKHNKTAPPDRATVAGSGISRSPITHRVQRPTSSATADAIPPTPRSG